VAKQQSGKAAYLLFILYFKHVSLVKWLVVAYNCKMAGLGLNPCLYIFKAATD
jgi:hypothetical protein